MEENSALNWRRTSTKITIKSHKCQSFTLRYLQTGEFEVHAGSPLDQHLKERDYKYSIMWDGEFYQSKVVLEGKVKHLRQQGKGKRPNAASALTSEEVERFWAAKTLDDSSPGVLSQMMWWKATEQEMSTGSLLFR